jgi:hypothetical protein
MEQAKLAAPDLESVGTRQCALTRQRLRFCNSLHSQVVNQVIVVVVVANTVHQPAGQDGQPMGISSHQPSSHVVYFLIVIAHRMEGRLGDHE